ncbi:MAG TPA: hypothetical protein VGD37_10605, partial [Kofleriaceae bacterium]
MTDQAYLGAIGRTRTALVHVTARRGALVAVEVHTSVDAAADPELADQLCDDTLNVMQLDDGSLLRIAVPVIYHDPLAGQLVLVLCETHRHSELDERIRVLEQLRDDEANVPAYAKDFAVVFGGAALRAYLDRGPGRALDAPPGPEAEAGEPAYVAEAAIAAAPAFRHPRATGAYPAFSGAAFDLDAA